MSRTSKKLLGPVVALCIAATLSSAAGSGAMANRQDDGPAVEIAPPPGLVALTAGDPEGQRLQYEWDFDSDADVDRPIVIASLPNPR